MQLEQGAAYMTLAEFDGLLEYSCSMPTGTQIGKMWKRGEPYMEPREHWYLGKYVEHAEPDKVGIEWREIFIVQELGHE